jgi:hypothetical protein
MGHFLRFLISLRGFVTVVSLVIGLFSLAYGIQIVIQLPHSRLGQVATFIGVINLLNAGYHWRWPWRFNLRTLFIVTTMLGVFLGMIVGLDKFGFGIRSVFFATTILAVVLGMIAWLDRAWIGK